MRECTSVCAGSVRVHLRYLRRCGFCRAAPAAAPASRARLHDLYRGGVLAVTAAYLAQECVYAYRERADMDKLARVMFLLLCHVTSIAKQLVFYCDAARIDRLVAGLDEAVYNAHSEAGTALVARVARDCGRFARAYSAAAVVTCTLWITFPVLQRLRRQHIEFPFWLPGAGAGDGGDARFAAVLVYSYYVTTLVGIANTTMDAFVATVLKLCKTQLTILRTNLAELPARALIEARRSARSPDEALSVLFLDSLAHYNKITEDIALLQDIFGFAILIQFGIGGWILCMAAYQIVSLSILSIEFASMTLFISCILTELFLYCYYGNEVTVESDRLVAALYAMEWTALSPRFRRALLVVMERAKRPLRPAAGVLVPLSLETFLKILKFSWSFYAVLRQTK